MHICALKLLAAPGNADIEQQMVAAAAVAASKGAAQSAAAGGAVKVKRLKTTYVLDGAKVKRALSAYNFFCAEYGYV